MKLAGAQKALAKEQEERTAATYNGRVIRRNGEILRGDERRGRVTNIIVLPGVTAIHGGGYGEGAFRGCSSLSSITLPEGITSIGVRAFYGCTSLSSITLPEGITSIGRGAFHGCSSLSSITLPEGITSIGGEAFYGCSSLYWDWYCIGIGVRPCSIVADFQ